MGQRHGKTEDMAKKKFLFVAQEVEPYLPADYISSLGNFVATGVHKRGYEARTFTPKWGTINERRNQLHEVIRLSGLNVPIDDNDHPLLLKVASLHPSRTQVYFIDNDDYFLKQASDIDDVGTNRTDNDQRIIFFTRSTVETAKKLQWDPAIIHSQGWVSALVPVYLRHLDTGVEFPNSKVVYTVLPDEIEKDTDSVRLKLDDRFFCRMREDGVNADYLSKFESYPLDAKLLHRMAIDNADGVIFMTDEPDPELLSLVEEAGLPYMNKEEGSNIEAYIDFYDKLQSSK